MKNTNIGIANLIISNKFKNSYFNNLIEESKKITSDYLDVIKNSPILMLEFNVYNNIENKHIENELIASRYIDNNIKLFEVYTINEIEEEHKKLNKFINEEIIPNNDKTELYNAINTLIKESLNNNVDINVNNIHESFVLVLNHIKEPKNKIVETIDSDLINEEVLEIAVNKLNQKYESLNEDDKYLFKKLTTYNDDEKKELLEAYKNENISILEANNSTNFKDNISKAILKIKEMKYNKSNVNDDILTLYELKKELL